MNTTQCRSAIAYRFSVFHFTYVYLILITIFALHINNIYSNTSEDTITIAILAKDKAHCLPLYLHCIEQQTWPKSQTNIYIRTNNNTDNTAEILRSWAAEVADQYANVYFDDADVEENVQQYSAHEWNPVRFQVLGTIRNASLKWAYEHKSHYFVADCDNFILPHTLETMVKTGRPIVAPFLICYSNKHNGYSNYHDAITIDGYMEQKSTLYFPIFYQYIKGIIQLPVIHCTYFIHKNVLPELNYLDDTNRHEYVIFSEQARKKNIGQYLDNREIYGFLTFASTKEGLAIEFEKIYKIIEQNRHNDAEIRNKEEILTLEKHIEKWLQDFH